MKTWTPRQIRNARLARRWTQCQLAKVVGVTTQTVQNYERGRRRPRASVLSRLDAIDMADLIIDPTIGFPKGTP